MSFQYPLVLILLIIPIVLAFYEWVRKGHPVVMPFDHGDQKKGHILEFCINFLNMLPPALLFMTIVILANPRKSGPPETKREMTNVQFCLDVSGSMTAKFGDSDRYGGAMEAIKSFVNQKDRVGKDAFGLTIFGNDVIHWVPLTKDITPIPLATPFLHPRKLPRWFGSGTQIGKALLACRDELKKRNKGDRLIILVTDGSSADLQYGAAQQVASLLKEDDIVVYVIGLAEACNNSEMYTIGNETGGDVFDASDPAMLSSVFSHIDSMQTIKETPTILSSIDNFKPYCLIALILLAIQALVLFGLRYTPW